MGKYFRRRYGKILGNEYSSDEIYVVSTDHDRAIKSAQANLAGLYETTNTEIWHNKNSFPVHTLPSELDNILRPEYGDRCPRFTKLYNWYIEDSPEATSVHKKYGHLFRYWAEKSGKNVHNVEDLFSIYKIYVDRKRENQT